MNIEQKFIFIGHHTDPILEWAEYSCVHDPAYYSGTISSIYFDTPSLYHYCEKRNSDYVKSKVRLRWYEDVHASDRTFDVPCFIEVKTKRGVSRHKGRKQILLSSDRLRDDPFSDEEILAIPEQVYELDYLSPGILVPMLLIQYNRRRYVEPDSGSRIAIDTDIRCVRANGAYVAGLPPVHLEAGVLEIKGPLRGLPRLLMPLSAQLTPEAFSKYARCWEHLMLPLGRRI